MHVNEKNTGILFSSLDINLTKEEYKYLNDKNKKLEENPDSFKELKLDFSDDNMDSIKILAKKANISIEDYVCVILTRLVNK